MPSIHDIVALDQHCRRVRIDGRHLRRFRAAFCKHWHAAETALEQLPELAREELADQFELHALRMVCWRNSKVDGASKLIFRTAKGFLIESVLLRIASGRTAVCVSSQVGCAAHCGFCATGKMGVAHDLSAAEILDQIVQAGERLQQEGRPLRNVVFMGMGEPLHNEENLHEALDVLFRPECFHFAPRHVMVSTVGIPDAMLRTARRFPQLRLALSLHSARQEIRLQIMPLAARHSLDDLRETIVEINAIQNHPVMIEYLLLGGLTDTDEDIEALCDYLRDLDVHVNLMPYNPIDDAPELTASTPQRRKAFASAIRSRGFKVTTRRSLGADIAAACGQLVRQENRAIVAAAATASDPR